MQIINNLTASDIHAEKIVRRVIAPLDESIFIDLKSIVLDDYDPQKKAFAKYSKKEQKIYLYISEITEWQPWILRKSYFFPYLTIGLALAHEIAHLESRNEKLNDKELYAETSAINYLYPSMGILKPFVWLIRKIKRERK